MPNRPRAALLLASILVARRPAAPVTPSVPTSAPSFATERAPAATPDPLDEGRVVTIRPEQLSLPNRSDGFLLRRRGIEGEGQWADPANSVDRRALAAAYAAKARYQPQGGEMP